MCASEALSIGDVLLILTRFARPKPKHKYAICVCPVNRWFLLINSEPRRINPDAQIEITPSDLSALKHPSFIDASKIVAYSLEEIESASPKGSVPHVKLTEIARIVARQEYMPPKHKRAVVNNFSS